MATNGVNVTDDADMAECDGEKVVTMVDVLQEQQEFEEDANAVLGASDDKNCTYPKGYIKRQAIYACLTCCNEAKTDPSKRAGVCLACSLTCHENHELVELYTKRNFRCDCGNPKFNAHPCQYTPNKTDLNDDNKYNQNFSGIYCICRRPYPDPDSTEEDQMIQCIVCEDWYHASHLAATVPPNDQYSEMICQACMKKNDFLHDYSSLAVNIEETEVDVENSITDVKITDSATVDNEDSTKAKLVKVSMEVETGIPNGKETKENSDVEMSEAKTDKDEDLNSTEVKSSDVKENTESTNTKEKTDVEMLEAKTDKGDDLNSTEVKSSDIEENTESTTSKENTDAEMSEAKNDKDEDLKSSEVKSSDIKENTESTTTEETTKNTGVPMESDSLEDTIKEVQQEIDSSNINDGKPQDSTVSINTSKESITESKSEEQNTSESLESTVSGDSENNTLNTAKEVDPSTTNELGLQSSENITEPKNSSSISNSINKDYTKVQEESKDTGSKGEKEMSAGDKVTGAEMFETETVAKKENNVTEEQSNFKTTELKMEEDLQQESTLQSDDKDFVKNKNNEDISTATGTPVEKDEQIHPSIENTEMAENKQPTETEQPSSTETKLNDMESLNTKSSKDEAINMPKENESVQGNDTEKEDTNKSEAEDALDKQDAVSSNINGDAQNLDNANENKDVEINKETNKSSNPENSITKEAESSLNIESNTKRKLSTEEPIEESVLKKAKLDEMKCVRPRNVKRVYKGATFWPSDFRQKLCTCNECISMYKDLAVLFLIDPEDTVQAYETLGKEIINGAPATQYEKGLEALSSLDRIQQINALTEYNKMRDKLLDFLKSFKERKEIVKEEDIKAFFAGMKPKREPDGVYFCR